VEKDLADKYSVDICVSPQLTNIFQFLCPILDPSRPAKVHIFQFDQVYLSWSRKVKVNWTKNLYWSLYKIALTTGNLPALFLSPFLFHFYDHYDALTKVQVKPMLRYR
jgi:hypothetical protein